MAREKRTDEFFSIVNAAAASGESDMRRAFQKDVAALRRAADLSVVTGAASERDVDGVIDALVPEDADLPMTREAWVEAFNAGGKAAARDLASAVRRNTRATSIVALVKPSFSETNPEAVRFAAEESAKRVRGITRAMREAIREELARAFTDGIAPRELAKNLIERELGLDRRRMKAVRDFAKELAEKVADGRLSKERADSRVEKYAAAQLRQRALTIARTETIAAAQNGQQELFRQASEAGLFDAQTAKREWIVTPDDRLDAEVCEPMDGQEVGLNESFETGNGERVLVPPAHPNCRCAVVLVL